MLEKIKPYFGGIVGIILILIILAIGYLLFTGKLSGFLIGNTTNIITQQPPASTSISECGG
jgi:hypothetical protein